MFTERVSSLEGYALCPKKYKEVPFDGTNTKTILATGIGDIVHLAHQYPLLAKILAEVFCDETIPKLLGKKDNLLKEQIYKMIDLAADWIEEFKDNEKYFEVKNTRVIEGVYVTGSYDCLVIEKDGTFHLFDYKTAGNINYYSNWLEKTQPLMYAYFIMKQFGIEELKFSYQIYVKGKDNGKVTPYRKTKMFYLNKVNKMNQIDYIDNIGNKVETLVKNFRMMKETDFFPAKNTNEDGSRIGACYYCPLRTAEGAAKLGKEQCGLWSDQIEILDVGKEIDFGEDIDF